ncbi:TOX high mobility group box family member 4-B isoform X1 [Drosophila albomicans]|uniref:TOX high mobility group box family member 4-B isoform X1 n=1 Tax=Drosophila albomicans TaxID=7291 RepID=A0A6P8Z2C2_DROAB|nr:TOX high mobility group box family member 4-B isoform X1 [Drosophila albomicans]
MNQFHTPSFGDEVFEMNDTPMEQTPNPNSSRRISRLSSLDHVEDASGEEHMDYETSVTATNSSVASTNQAQPQQQQTSLPAPQSLQSQSQLPAKPLAPFALFFRDTMTAIKQQNPACTLEQITAIVHNMWDTMEGAEKAVYERRHEMEKRDYMLKLRDQRLQQLQEVTPQQQPTLEESQTAAGVEQQQETTGTSQTATFAVEDVASTVNAPTTATAVTPQQPEQIQLLNEAAAVQKCTRELCNKPAIINPDWEDEYCSNECVVIHCRNVFNEWARALQYSPP